MTNAIPPFLIYLLGALLVPLVRLRYARQALILSVPLIALAAVLSLAPGTTGLFRLLGVDLILLRVDKLSLLFGYIFIIMSLIGLLYALHIRENGQHVAAMAYVGSTLGVVFAGDFLTLFLFWELMAVSSVFLIWYRKSETALAAGFRYILVHMAGGTFLLAGILIHAHGTGSITVGPLDFSDPGPKLMLIGFLINAAVPPFHAWLADAYPEGTITGSVFLTAFTTKSAVYVLARTFPGLELLVWLGAIMALYGVVYAVLENDIRRLLAYHIISQVGYMVCGVGLGSAMAVNGAAAHAFCHILYKAVLFMGAGAVIHVTGRSKMTDLQGRGLYRQMPVTLSLYMIGAFSISAVPLFNGFISKTMVVAAAGALHRPAIELMLHLASVGTFLHTGLKLPWGTWFGRTEAHENRITQAKEPPLNMLAAMGLAAGLCILTGVYPRLLYDLLPHPVEFHPYLAGNVVAMLQLLLFTLAAFWLYVDKLGGEPFISLDTDWFYRIPARALMAYCHGPIEHWRRNLREFTRQRIRWASQFSTQPFSFLIIPGLSKSGQNISDSERAQSDESQLKNASPPYNPQDHQISMGAGIYLAVLFILIGGAVILIAG